MELIAKIQEDLKQMLSPKRYIHSVGTMQYAKQLAKQYGEDIQKAALAGLTHDIAKELPQEEAIQYAQKNAISVNRIEAENPGLLHGKIGAHIVKQKYHFSQDMQNAIAYHTTGNPKMDTLAKIVFIADKAEKNRKYDDVETVRKLAKQDLDTCMLYILDFTIKKNIEKEKTICVESILTRNEILLDRR